MRVLKGLLVVFGILVLLLATLAAGEPIPDAARHAAAATVAGILIGHLNDRVGAVRTASLCAVLAAVGTGVGQDEASWSKARFAVEDGLFERFR